MSESNLSSSDKLKDQMAIYNEVKYKTLSFVADLNNSNNSLYTLRNIDQLFDRETQKGE